MRLNSYNRELFIVTDKYMMAEFSIIAATDDEDGLGRYGNIPWRVPSDLQYFIESTYAGIVIMGRVTFQSLKRRLKNRTNVVISSVDKIDNDTGKEQPHFMFKSLIDALDHFSGCNMKVWVIGGEQLYKEAITLRECNEIVISKIPGKYQCDRKFPKIPEDLFTMYLTKECDGFVLMKYKAHKNSNEADTQYAKVVGEILKNGNDRETRNSVCRSIFAPSSLRFNLRQGFPLLSTKKIGFKLICEELFWFLRGSTNANELKERGVNIWGDNADEFYRRDSGMNGRDFGDLGKVYGYQLKHFGRISIDDAFVGEGYDGLDDGFDQMRYVIDTIRKDPSSRRIIFSYLNPKEMFGTSNEAALPCCHVMAQFYVDDGCLSCHMYQRSADAMLGLPFNCASYGLLTELIARACSLKTKELVMSFGDVHVYKDHMQEIERQIHRTSYEQCCVEISDRVVGTYLEDLTMSDVKLIGYQSHTSIKVKMVV